MFRGSCLCGGIRFALTEPPRMLGVCHCSRCRKAGDSAFFVIGPDTFQWESGEDLVVHPQPEPPFTHSRCFCRRCGTTVGELRPGEDTWIVSANAVDDDTGLRVRFHEFVADKPAWLEIGDAAPQFPGRPVRPEPAGAEDKSG